MLFVAAPAAANDSFLVQPGRKTRYFGKTTAPAALHVLLRASAVAGGSSDFFAPLRGPFWPKRPLRHSYGFEVLFSPPLFAPRFGQPQACAAAGRRSRSCANPLEVSLLVDLEAASGFGFPRLAALFGRGWS